MQCCLLAAAAAGNLLVHARHYRANSI